MKRRHVITALGTAGAAAAAGCISGNDDDTAPDEGGADGPDDTGGVPGADDDGQSPDELGDPNAVVESFLAAAAETDSERAAALLHPAHPFHPDNLDEDVPFERVLGSVTVGTVETEVVAENVGIDTVTDRIAGWAFFFEAEQLADVVDDGRSALVEATASSDGESMTLLSVVAVHDGEWRLLWQGDPADEAAPVTAFERRVVDGVRFDTGQDRARVQFVDDPVADRVTVESASMDTYTATDTPVTTDYLSAGLDPAGDAVVVTAAVDGESRVVHRERYPPGDRPVEAVTFDTDSPDDPLQGTARVEFAAVESDGELRIVSTRAGGESSLEPAESADYLVVDIDPDGDEVVVTLTEAGETEELHRERSHP